MKVLIDFLYYPNNYKTNKESELIDNYSNQSMLYQINPNCIFQNIQNVLIPITSSFSIPPSPPPIPSIPPYTSSILSPSITTTTYRTCSPLLYKSCRSTAISTLLYIESRLSETHSLYKSPHLSVISSYSLLSSKLTDR